MFILIACSNGIIGIRFMLSRKEIDHMLSSNLKELRKAKGLTQEEFAAKLHVVRQKVSKWETGLSAPDAETLLLISDVLEVPVDVLLGETIVFSEGQTEVAAIAEKLTVINEQLGRASEHKRKTVKIISVVGLITVLLLIAWAAISSIFLNQLSVSELTNPAIVFAASIIGIRISRK